MHHKTLPIAFAVLIAAMGFAPTTAQAQSVDSQFCGRTNITDAALKLTRDWGERYKQEWVDFATRGHWVGGYSVVRVTSTEVICRINFIGYTPTVPSHDVELREVDFRYSLSDGSLEPVTLPMSGFTEATAILATWERVYIDRRTFRSILEEKAEHDPALAAEIGEVLGRPKGSENATWAPAGFCDKITADTAATSIIHWADAMSLWPAYPLILLDFEASALSLDSFPIEVGIAIQAVPGGEITSWSALIKPDPAWPLDVQWDPDAERLHGISRWDLRQGITPHAAVAALNSRIPDGVTAWCDGGHYDLRWMERLAAAAEITPTFTLHDLSEAWSGNDALTRGRIEAENQLFSSCW